MATFLQLQDKALKGFDATTYRADAKDYLNEGQQRVFRRVGLREGEGAQSYTTVSGTNTLALPSNFVRLRSLFNTTDREPLEEWELRDVDDADTSSGKPYAYALSGSTLLLYPTPDAAYSLQARYRTSSTTLSVDGDIPALPSDYHDLLVTYARARLFRDEDDFEAANFYIAQFKADLAEAASDLMYPSENRVSQVEGMWASEPWPTFSTP